ncbi:hypothetical protein ES707_10663 [subsurface metagenome]
MLISFTNGNGETFNIHGNYILSPNWSGFGEVPIKHQLTKAPYQDGRTYIDTVFEPRDLTIEFTIKGNNRQEVFDRRANVARHFNPKLGVGTLIWQQENGTIYCIDCIPKTPVFPSGDGQSYSHQIVIIQFLAPNPFWYDPMQIEKILVGFSGGWSYPWSFPMSYGQVGTQLEVINTGNIDTPVMIYLYGEVVDPRIQNLTTEEEISIILTVADGDILIINTAFGEKAALILSGGEYNNAFEYVDPESIFWKLKPGSNTLGYTVASEGENAQCRIYYYNRFSGV